MYKIEFKTSVLKDIRNIPQAFLEKIESMINSLAKNPHPNGARKIKGYKNHFRLRVGMYRIIYQVEKKIEIITIIKIGHRKEVYEKF